MGYTWRAADLSNEEMDTNADEQIIGPTIMSGITPITLWIYDAGNTNVGYTNIEAAYNRIFSLLHGQQITGSLQMLWKGVVKNKREPDLKDAAYWRTTFYVYGYQTV